MSVLNTTIPWEPGTTFERHYAALGSGEVLAQVASLSEEDLSDYLELLAEYRRSEGIEDKRELLGAMVEIVLDEPVEVVSIDDVERESSSTLEGAAAAERLKRGAQQFGRNLKRLRSARKMNQASLAELADMTQPQISYLERGEHRPQECTVKKLADALGVSRDELLPLEE